MVAMLKSKQRQQGNRKPHAKDPLAEGLQKKGTRRDFTEADVTHIKKRYGELSAEGKKNIHIARDLANEMGRSAGSVAQKIINLINAGELEKNPNRRTSAARKNFTESEVGYIKKRHMELVAKGMNNRQISKEIANGIGRNAGSIEFKIRELINAGELEKNPNQKKKVAAKRFTESDMELIKQRWRELAAQRKENLQIAKDIAKSLGRTVYSVNSKINKLINAGELEKNPNRRKTGVAKRFTQSDIAYIKKRHAELAANGMNDAEIARDIANEMGRTVGSLRCKITQLTKKGKFGKNPNRRKVATGRKFTKSELERIKKRYGELVAEGKNNSQISIEIANEMGRNAGSVNFKIRELIKAGELEKNPNRRKAATGRKFTESEIEYIKKRYRELAAKGNNNKEISRDIAKRIGRSARSVNRKIGMLTEEGELEKNPNQRRSPAFLSKMTDDEFVNYAKEIIREAGITSRYELAKKDGGLYQELGKRGLIDRVFAEIGMEQAASHQEQLLSDIRECFDAYTGDAP